MNYFDAELNNCKFKPIALSVVAPFAESFVLKSRKILTVLDLAQVQTDKQPKAGCICYCRRNTDEKGVFCCNPKCPMFLFIYHVSRLKALEKLGTAPIAET